MNEFDNLDFAAIMVVAFLAACAMLTFVYAIYSLIKWHSKRREKMRYKNTLIEIWESLSEFERHLWRNVGELN